MLSEIFKLFLENCRKEGCEKDQFSNPAYRNRAILRYSIHRRRVMAAQT